MSPTLQFAHLCDHAFFSREGKLNIIGMFSQINVSKLPTSHPQMTVALAVTIQKTTKLKVQILKKETGETISKIEASLERNSGKESDKEVYFVSDFNAVQFEEAGDYRVEIWLDQQLIQTLPFSIRIVKRKK